MMKQIYNIFHIPYYLAYITKDNEVLRTVVIKQSKGKAKYFRVKKLNGVFILPKMGDTPPVKNKSGYMLVYDIRNTFPMKLMSGDEKNEYDEELSQKGIMPKSYIATPMDIEELHTFLEAKVTEDILSDNQKEIPMWLIYLVSIGIVAVLILGAFYMMTKGQQPVIINGTIPMTPYPTPTPGYVVIP